MIQVIFDEIHDLVESKSDGTGTDAQNCFIQLTRPARNTWLVTATPFPKGNLSVYGLHQVLGFKRCDNPHTMLLHRSTTTIQLRPT